MFKTYKKSRVADLRKKTDLVDQLNLKYINLASCIFIGLIIAVLIASIITVAGYPNSNFPANI